MIFCKQKIHTIIIELTMNKLCNAIVINGENTHVS